jgi:hypothetical protein
MSYISREEFLKRQKEREERSSNFQNQGPRVSYFSLKDDGDEAVVRFAYNSPDELYQDIFPTHQVTIDGKFRRVKCLRENYKSPISDCPFCVSGTPVNERFYIKLIEYSRNENGEIEITPKVWERPTSYIPTLNGFFDEYGDIAEMVFKIKRSGAKGSLQTTYSILPANQKVYNEALYPIDFSAFNNYKVEGSALAVKTAEEMEEMLGVKEEKTEESTPVIQQSAPRRVTY